MLVIAVVVPWDCRTYDIAVGANDGGRSKAEATLKKQYPPLPPRSINVPSVVEDVRGEVQAYYLPGVLTKQRQVADLNFPTFLCTDCGIRSASHRQCIYLVLL